MIALSPFITTATDFVMAVGGERDRHHVWLKVLLTVRTGALSFCMFSEKTEIITRFQKPICHLSPRIGNVSAFSYVSALTGNIFFKRSACKVCRKFIAYE